MRRVIITICSMILVGCATTNGIEWVKRDYNKNSAELIYLNDGSRGEMIERQHAIGGLMQDFCGKAKPKVLSIKDEELGVSQTKASGSSIPVGNTQIASSSGSSIQLAKAFVRVNFQCE